MSNYPSVEFTLLNGCGQGEGKNPKAAQGGPLNVNQQASINKNTDLSSCMVSNDNGCVYGIFITGSTGPYDYAINVDAQGPKGTSGGNMYLAFIDETTDIYRLAIYSHTRSLHTVRYNSKKPGIIKIMWSNNPIHSPLSEDSA